MVSSDSSVLTSTQAEAYSASPPYFSAKIAVVLPAGMPASTTHTPVTSASNCARRHTSSVSSGMPIRRTAQKYSVSG